MGLSLIVLFSLGLLVIPSLLLSKVRRLLLWPRGHGKATRFPGPRQFPLIGRVHDLPRFSMWLKFKEWADTYGSVYETSMMGQKFIIISDEDIASEVLIKQGDKFAGRAQLRAILNHKESHVYEALQDRHDAWKTQRKWVHAAMAASYQQHFFGHIEREIKRYLVTLLLDPAKFHTNTRELTGRIMCTLSWDAAYLGKRFGDDAIEMLTRMSIPGTIVNPLPALWHIGDFVRYNPWRRYEEARQDKQRAFWRDTLQVAKQRFLAGDLPSYTWAYRYLSQLADEGNITLEQAHEEEDFAACMLGFQNMVGVVTISGPLQFFLMSMGLHPEWQKKAQEEIDRVCGDRMPSIGDYANLPTVRACVKETLRWRSTVPLGVPHQCEASTEWRGVHIEKGTIVMACEWNINRVPSKFPDPENFHPERWLEPGWPTYQEPLSQFPSLREGHAMHTFGWGRRACLGRHLADDEMFLVAASVLWGFDLAPQKDPRTGKEVPFDNQATNSNVILEPKPFPMGFAPRSEGRAKAMMDEYATVRGSLKAAPVIHQNIVHSGNSDLQNATIWTMET